jgi:hypothetical protein
MGWDRKTSHNELQGNLKLRAGSRTVEELCKSSVFITLVPLND